LRTVLDDFKRRLFWIVARTCFVLYRWFPLFGKLRAALGIVQRDGQFLIIHRNDGRGFCLPGGICGWRENAEATLRREIQEETGLIVTERELKLDYFSNADVPCNISVFAVQATGELKNSWEGSAHWMTLAELEPRLLLSQQPVLETLRRMSAISTAPGSNDRGPTS
jgi:8-oxo-dGTP pyrophosphatase MutT (NUDIX family)